MTTTDHTATDEVDAAILRGLIDRRIEADGPDFDYADSHLIAYARSVRAALERAHLLLPSGGEVRTRWGVRWHATPGCADEWDDWGFLDEAHAREEMASSPTPYTLLRRRTITLPVEPVVSDNSEVPR